MYINEYMISKRLNIPPARSLDEMDYRRSVILSLINEELTACQNRKGQIDGRK